MRVYVLVTVLAMALPVVQTTAAQDFDPTAQILPFVEETRLIADGRYDEAVDVLHQDLNAIGDAMSTLSFDIATPSRNDPRHAAWLTGLINQGLAYHLYCHALAGLVDDTRTLQTCAEDWDIDGRILWCATADRAALGFDDVDDCVRRDLARGSSWTPHFQGVAKALILEAEADYDGAFDAYDAATDLRRSIYAFERLLSDYDDTTLPATKLLWDYIHYRFVRLLVVGGERALVQMASSLLPSSYPFDGPNPCVGSTTTLKGIQEFATGFRLGAGDHLSEALELPQHWVGLDTYEHPLFWLAASSHRNGDPKGVAHALDYRAELGDDLTPDVAYVLDLYGGDVDIADGAVPSVCDTPGCLYFLAQYLYGLDRVEEGNAVLRASRAMCEITPTLVCAIVRFSNTKLDAGGVL